MQKQVRTMGRSNSSTRSVHRSFVAGCASNAIRAAPNRPRARGRIHIILRRPFAGSLALRVEISARKPSPAASRTSSWWSSPPILAEAFSASDLGLGRLLEGKRTRLELAARLVGRHHHARAGDLAIDELQGARRSACAEQALPVAEDDREDPHAELVDQAVPDEGLDEVRAAVDLELWTLLLLETGHSLADVALEQLRVLPLQARERPGSHVLGGAVELRRAGLVGVRPVRGEDLVGLPAEDQVERLPHEFAHNLAHLIVPEGNRPAAVLEAAGGIFLGAAGCLHDPIEADERVHDELPHGSSSLVLKESDSQHRPNSSAGQTDPDEVVLSWSVDVSPRSGDRADTGPHGIDSESVV